MSHIKNDINQINNTMLLSLDSCLIQALLGIHLPKLKLVRKFLLNYIVVFCSITFLLGL